MNYKYTLGVTIASHIPQIIQSIKTGKKTRVIADPDKFWNKKVISLHLLALSTLIAENKDNLMQKIKLNKN